jgi:hypothetical protein
VASDSHENKTDARRGSPVTLAILFLLRLRLHPSERESEAVGVATGRRSGVVARLLTDGRRSLEGERTVVEQPRCDALIRELEPVNPRVSEIWHGPSKSRAPYSYARVSEIWGFFVSFSIRFLFTLNQAVRTLDLNKSSQLRGPDSKTVLDLKP